MSPRALERSPRVTHQLFRCHLEGSRATPTNTCATTNNGLNLTSNPLLTPVTQSRARDRPEGFSCGDRHVAGRARSETILAAGAIFDTPDSVRWTCGPPGDVRVYGGAMHRRPMSPSDCAGTTTRSAIKRTGHQVATFPVDPGARVEEEKSSDLLAPTSTSTDAYHGVTRRPASPPSRAKRGEERTMVTMRTR